MVCWMGRFLCHGLYLHLHSQVHLLILTSQFRGSWIQKSHTILHLLCKCGFVQTWCKFHMWGLVKTPSPFKWFFQMLSFCFPLIVFPSAGFTPWPKNSHERGKGKGKGIVKEGKGKNRKGRGKGKRKEKERERKRKKKAVSHTDHFWCLKLSFSLSFCYRSWILCVFLFFWKWLQSSKKECSDHLPGTFLVQNLRHYDNKQWKEETKSTK